MDLRIDPLENSGGYLPHTMSWTASLPCLRTEITFISNVSSALGKLKYPMEMDQNQSVNNFNRFSCENIWASLWFWNCSFLRKTRINKKNNTDWTLTKKVGRAGAKRFRFRYWTPFEMTLCFLEIDSPSHFRDYMSTLNSSETLVKR